VPVTVGEVLQRDGRWLADLLPAEAAPAVSDTIHRAAAAAPSTALSPAPLPHGQFHAHKKGASA
jgi:hypothetical protein